MTHFCNLKYSCQFELSKNWLSEAKLKARSEASRQISNSRYFDAKLRFALFASLRSAIFYKIKIDNELVIFPVRVKIYASRQISYSGYFDAKLRFALFASLRSAIYNKIKIDNELVIFPAKVKL